MPNTPHCRFANTLADLRDCYTHMDDKGLSREERAARQRLIILVSQIASDYDPDIEEGSASGRQASYYGTRE